jgi:hypothetical protein
MLLNEKEGEEEGEGEGEETNGKMSTWTRTRSVSPPV